MNEHRLRLETVFLSFELSNRQSIFTRHQHSLQNDMFIADVTEYEFYCKAKIAKQDSDFEFHRPLSYRGQEIPVLISVNKAHVHR